MRQYNENTFFTHMKCQDARKVWSHPAGPIEGVKEVFPLAWQRLEGLADAFSSGGDCSFNSSLRDLLDGAVGTAFYADHSDDNDPVAEQVHGIVGDAAMSRALSAHFSSVHGTPIMFGNVCCSSCLVSHPDISDEEVERIQRMAIRIG